MAAKRDYYEVLGVARDAASDDIKKAYKKLAVKFHPDRNPGDAAAVAAFKEAAEAFDVLSNDEKRARYDRFGHAGVEGAAGRGGAGGFSDVNDIFDAFGEIFGDILGGGRRRGGGPRARRGDSLRTSITIDLVDAATGCARELEIPRREPCQTCRGSGAKPGTSPERCEYCGGHGQVIQSQGFFRMQTTCPACRGSGQTVKYKCTDCQGSGSITQTEKLQVKVPAGVDNGMQLCLRGEGEAGELGGPAGDLYVDIVVRDHKFFRRQGRDLICEVPITYAQACLGTELEIPLLTGKHQLQIPAGTQAGEVLRQRGLGLPDTQGHARGDLLVQVTVEVPKKLTKRQEELLRQLAEHDHKHVSQHRKSFFESIKDYFVPTDESPEGPKN